jgi:hypothetical protein
MKTIKNLLSVSFAILLMQPVFLKAQTVNHKASITLVQSDWKPVNAFENTQKQIQHGTEITAKPALINVINGVSFYSKIGECGNSSSEITLVKVTNVNTNPVKISWQRSAQSPVEFVIIPASKEVEGSCNTNSKLAISLPKDETEKEKITSYILSHITVVEVKN